MLQKDFVMKNDCLASNPSLRWARGLRWIVGYPFLANPLLYLLAKLLCSDAGRTIRIQLEICVDVSQDG